jgi:hypothetical protein
MANSRIVSLLDPKVPGVDRVDGKTLSGRKSGIHPRTSYEAGSPHAVTPFGSDDEEELDDIKKAQRLEMNVSPISSNPKRHRCIRQILRGDYKTIAKEAAQGLRRQRMYLVATDLSEEAAYALEWTIGTVLKDGDTLFAIYCAESEEGAESYNTKDTPRAGSVPESMESSAVDIGQGADMMNDTAEMVRMLSKDQGAVIIPAEEAYTHNKTGSTASLDPNRLSANRRPSSPGPRSISRAPPQVQRLRRTDFTGMKALEIERWKSAEAITERCIALLRKTKLQVRVVVDTFHCKVPREMITEVVSSMFNHHRICFDKLTCHYRLTISNPRSWFSALEGVLQSKASFSALSVTTLSQDPLCPSWSRERSSRSQQRVFDGQLCDSQTYYKHHRAQRISWKTQRLIN